ncbi:MAG: ribbon-helix-helix protein, CopG family [Acidobacteria bacterium]|nr:ribbon-helix-helix protein, CopG family [Acidobacteriota bacterium]MCA1650799.1 ribbon-helix-helix protein, CopG family [Acidobacteriota bacterium]
MTPDRVLTFRPDDALLEAMELQRERHGTPYSEQIRRALRAWLEKQGVNVKTERPRAGTRKRS